ncbi:MAG: molybdopterin-dependent oxidoreductase, partial [Chloroflexota bacterium]|nr:molybdopterin-dependent oxidoreductase [Chloroflexota bacterium]
IILWGHNPASTGPHYMPFLREAQRNGAYVVVVDPRRTLTAKSADEFIQPLPATDAALALSLMQVIFSEGLHDEAWLEAHSVGWRDLRDRAASYPPARVAAITGVAEQTIIALARRIGSSTPTLLKFADGVQRHGNGGQTARALACLSAITGQIGLRGGGLAYSTSGYIHWDAEALGHASDSPPEPRILNINRLGALLAGEAADPPIMSLYVYCANPAASTPNTQRVLAGLRRDDLFTVVHDLFLTDSAREADIVLPATSQLEHVDLHKAYGQTFLTFNTPAIAPLGEAKSNWDTMRLLAAGMGYDDPWLRQEGEEVIAEVLDATRATNPLLAGITLERLKAEGHIPLAFAPGQEVPFADLRFPTPSGRVELRCEILAEEGLDPLPDYTPPAEYAGWTERRAAGHDDRLALVSGAAHHFTSSSMANLPSLLRREGEPFIELHPEDARERGIAHGDLVEVSNARGACQLRARLTDTTQRGVAVSPKGRWPGASADGRNINSTTSDALGDIAGQSTFHSNLVFVRPVAPAAREAIAGGAEESAATVGAAPVFHP